MTFFLFYTLQINSILNVGESAYSQIEKMKGQDDPQELNWKTNVKIGCHANFYTMLSVFVQLGMYPCMYTPYIFDMLQKNVH